MAQSKADFVRSLPPSTPAKEVIAKAKAAGLTLTAQYIYVIRSKNEPSRVKSAAGTRGKNPPAGSNRDKQFVCLVLDLGFARAQALLDEVRQKARAAL